MSKVKKGINICIGLVAFALGAIGVILPILPTTPFLLLASFCFAKGSERFNTWFISTKVYKKHLESFVKERAMTLKQKVILLAFADTMIAIPLITVDVLPMRITLIALILFIKMKYGTYGYYDFQHFFDQSKENIIETYGEPIEDEYINEYCEDMTYEDIKFVISLPGEKPESARITSPNIRF